MPTIAARRPGPCAACGALIERGELVEYQLAHGARHLACVDRPADLRRNRYVTECHFCRVILTASKGLLSVVEAEAGGRWVRIWRASCDDVGACNGRIRGQGQGACQPPPRG